MNLKYQERINWVDWAKSLCMFLVILGHTHIREQETFVGTVIYSFHMPLFFFLSGMLCKRELTLKAVVRDLRYIILPFFVYGIIDLSVRLLVSHSFTWINGWHRFCSLVIGLDPEIGAIWFLPALFVCKQLGRIMFSLRDCSNVLFVTLFLLICVLVVILPSCNLPFFMDSAIFGLPFFIMGKLFMERQNDFPCISGLGLLSMGIGAFLLNIIASIHNDNVILATCSYGSNVLLYYVAAISGIIAIICLCKSLNKIFSRFVYVTSYGSIVTLGLGGFPALFMNYYFFVILGIDPPATYSLLIAIFFSLITYVCCFFLILLIDKFLPSPFGLRGSLTKWHS